MECAEAFARCSVGERLKVGAVAVKDNRIIGCGYNALPEAIDGPLEDESNNTRPEVRHAEKNLLLGLARASVSSVGATLFVTVSCCKMCAIDWVEAGVAAVVYKHAFRLTEGLEYLREQGIPVYNYYDLVKED